MRNLILANFEHALCALLLFARLADIGSTWLASPTLRLEANVVMRRFRWKLAWASLLVCLIPYYNATLAVLVLPMLLLVPASNLSKVWSARALGEDGMVRMQIEIARRSTLGKAVLYTTLWALMVALTGGVLVFLCPDPGRDWGYWFGLGIVLYAFAVWFHSVVALRGLYAGLRAPDAAAGPREKRWCP